MSPHACTHTVKMIGNALGFKGYQKPEFLGKNKAKLEFPK